MWGYASPVLPKRATSRHASVKCHLHVDGLREGRSRSPSSSHRGREGLSSAVKMIGDRKQRGYSPGAPLGVSNRHAGLTRIGSSAAPKADFSPLRGTYDSKTPALLAALTPPKALRSAAY